MFGILCTITCVNWNGVHLENCFDQYVYPEALIYQHATVLTGQNKIRDQPDDSVFTPAICWAVGCMPVFVGRLEQGTSLWCDSEATSNQISITLLGRPIP